MSELTDLSETDASNTSITGASVAENSAMADVNNAIRNLAGLLSRSYNRLTCKYASTGSANAYVLTPSIALSAYVTGERYSFRANFTNTAAATLNISGLGAKTLKKYTTAKADLAAGDIVSGQPVTAEYDGTDLVLTTPFSVYYEEGTWTPVLTFTTPGNLSVAYSQQVGVYTRTGRLVYIGCSIITSSFTHTTASGACNITGLPFNQVGFTGAACAMEWGGITKASYTNITARANGAVMQLLASGSGVATSSVTAANMPTGGAVEIRFNGVYAVS